MSAFNVGSTLLHSVSVAILTYGWVELGNSPNNDYIVRQKGGHFQFLTIQGLVAAWLTMVSSLCLDIVPAFTALKVAKRAFFMIAMPLAMCIETIYWTLLMFFPTLILRAPAPGELEPTSSGAVPELIRIPLSLDIALHAVPGVVLLLDFYLFEEKYTRGQALYGGALITIIAGIWYGWWVEYCASYNDIFPYPFLTFNPFHIRLCIYAGAAALAYSFFLMLNYWHPKGPIALP